MIDYLDSTQETEDLRLAGYISPGWYYWDETQAGCYGPYESQDAAAQAAAAYAEHLL